MDSSVDDGDSVVGMLDILYRLDEVDADVQVVHNSDGNAYHDVDYVQPEQQ
jgi:hypothetical protein